MDVPNEEAQILHPVVRIPPSPSTGPKPHTVEMIFRKFTARRVGLIRALTEDVEAFFRKCEPGIQSLYLYGNIDASWEVRQPEHKSQLGINLERKNMKCVKWLEHIAMLGDAWLIKVSFSLGQNLTAKLRERLFCLMNSLQTVHEAFLDSDTYHHLLHLEEKDEACRDQIICSSCDGHFHANAFWICCDVCKEWYHGKCVKVTADQADQMKRYECPDCLNEMSWYAQDELPNAS